MHKVQYRLCVHYIFYVIYHMSLFNPNLGMPAETIMAIAFEEEMHALRLVPDPSGTPKFVDEPYLQVSCARA